MALPKQVILIPLLREMSSLQLYNTIWAVIFPIVGWPFGVFLMKQFSEGIPGEMLEAARIDGASEAKTFVRIALPMIKPGIGALAIFTFINSWNDYFMQLIMLSSTSKLTISLGIAKLQAENSTDYGLIMAGAALAAVPIIIVFLAFQKYFTKGITMGAVKGLNPGTGGDVELSPSGLRPLLPLLAQAPPPPYRGESVSQREARPPAPSARGLSPQRLGERTSPLPEAYPYTKPSPLGKGVCGPGHRRMRGSLPEIARKRAVSAGSALISHLRRQLPPLGKPLHTVLRTGSVCI